jgi:hypothetical protein
MLVSALALAAASLGADPAAAPMSTASPAAVPIHERVAEREQARIPFTSTISGFRTERENGEDVVYIEAGINRWYRGELQCFGINDVRFAHGFAPVDRGFGVDRFTRVAFFSLGSRHPDECRLTSLVALTRDEAVELKLARKPKDDAAR